ncbi:MFS-type efflux pump ArsJ specific for 1-arseno-3-phosphoglycerate [hydrothermal vent metagenome]|uniref:MFS-type efflux pump ArsJ specific for 1-arseno-3-phosphoglycerate n=1 Tax=hydrothermal vent metagenome TaxID=652676 RepID=A0A3B0YD79_9ZZZZ
MQTNVQQYLLISAAYWVFTLTDGALRMLVVLYFHLLGYSPFEVAMLFLFYEIFGIITNLVGGWLGARIGLSVTMHIGLALQIVALLMLTAPNAWLGVGYVMLAQALSGIAKDLNKMAAKAGVKTLLIQEEKSHQSRLFKWISLLTGSKNALKGLGFFMGAVLLEVTGFRGALFILASALIVTLMVTALLLPRRLGKLPSPPKISQMLSPAKPIQWLSVARFFLFAARDIWFVVALPVFLVTSLGWSFSQAGAFLAIWIILYGIIQACVPLLLKMLLAGHHPNGTTARWSVFALILIPVFIAYFLQQGLEPKRVLIIGLGIFGFVFAINSAIHSYLIVAWSNNTKVSMNVGFYYMANAAGRLTGTLLSGLIYQHQGLQACLWWSAIFLLCAYIASLYFPKDTENMPN